jgi:hypothetical protein
MQTFDFIAGEITFTFIRVPYGKGDVWYHASFKKEEKVITFRMSVDENYWKIFDTCEKWLFDLQLEFNKAIKNYESNLYAPQENIGQKIKAAS